MIIDTDLKCKNAVITGSTQGLGYEVAKLLLEQQCSVVINSRNSNQCELVKEKLRKKSSEVKIIPIAADISEETGCEFLYKEAINKLLNIDILILNAAYDPPHFGSIESIPRNQINKAIAMNIQSQIKLCQLFLPEMVKNKNGVVILIGSAASQRGSNKYAIYAMTKAALSNFTMSLAAEYGPYNIRVNCIAPSIIKTTLSKDIWSDPLKQKKLINSYPLRRIGEAEEIAAMVLALCGKAGKWMTGQTLVIDGGQMASVGCYYD